MKKIIHTQLYNHLTTYDLLCSSQSGFRSGFSTLSAATKTLNNWYTNINHGFLTAAVFIDLRKAFDLVDHKLLINKLPHYNISSSQLIKAYLTNRTQHVKIESVTSSPKTVLMGIPQGSLIGPLLFTIFINDLPNIIEHSNIDMYADDTIILITTSKTNRNSPKRRSHKH